MPKLVLRSADGSMSIIANEPTLLQCAAHVERQLAIAYQMAYSSRFQLGEDGVEFWNALARFALHPQPARFYRDSRRDPQNNYDLTYTP